MYQTRRDLLFRITFQRIFWKYPKIGVWLLSRYGSFEALFHAPKQELRFLLSSHRELSKSFIEFDDWLSARRDLMACQKKKVAVCGIFDEVYPPLLHEIYDPPPVLMISGKSPETLSTESIAIVGARKATSHACHIAFELAQGLAAKGVTIVSGMAFGIDAAAHRGALSVGGMTVAVWGTGIDIVYPAQHRDLAHKIHQQGVIVSEFPCGMRATKWSFPQRNRIISGLCRGVIIVEAAAQSGSLITARYALEQGREVFAVPGQATSPLHAGTNTLLKEGAHFIERAEEVLATLSSPC